ncbi:MAG: hypothetical protein M1321_03250, partial [Candidatus Marsarchaeota archaeon]|nr:hypothetical protein [Candidatus Marsarchaeota archaeon]
MSKTAIKAAVVVPGQRPKMPTRPEFMRRLQNEQDAIIRLAKEYGNTKNTPEQADMLNRLNVHFHIKIETLAHTLHHNDAGLIREMGRETNIAIANAANETGCMVKYVNVSEVTLSAHGTRMRLYEYLNGHLLTASTGDEFGNSVAQIVTLGLPTTADAIKTMRFDGDFINNIASGSEITAGGVSRHVSGLHELRRGYVPYLLGGGEQLQALSINIKAARLNGILYTRHRNQPTRQSHVGALGGFVAETARVDSDTRILPTALVAGKARVEGSRVLGHAIISDGAEINHAIIGSSVQVGGRTKAINSLIKQGAYLDGDIYIEDSSFEGPSKITGTRIKIVR